MSRLLALLFGRLPLGWLQLTHRKGRFAGAIAGVGFADLLVFFQLGFVGGLDNHNGTPGQSEAIDYARHGAHGDPAWQ